MTRPTWLHFWDYANYYTQKNVTGPVHLEPLRQVINQHLRRLQTFTDASTLLQETAKSSKFVTIISKTSYRMIAISELWLCELEFVLIYYGTFLVFAFPKGSKLTKLVNWALYNRFYSVNDFVANWERVYFRNTTISCDTLKMQQPKRIKSDPIKLEDFLSGMILYGICLGIPFGCLLAELHICFPVLQDAHSSLCDVNIISKTSALRSS